MQIREGGLDDPRVVALLNAYFEGIRANTRAESSRLLDLAALRASDTSFWSAWDGEDLLGCAALKALDEAHGEVKSMRTSEEHMRRGTGASLLSHILSVGRERGYKRLSLETGTGDAFEPAYALYRQFGFTDCGPFAAYAQDPHSRFMSRVI